MRSYRCVWGRFSPGSEREIRYLAEHEWAQTAEDVLWRRSKAGLLMNEAQRARVAALMGR